MTSKRYLRRTVILGSFTVLGLTGLVLPNASALTTAPSSPNTRSAFSFLGVPQTGSGMLATIIPGFYNNHSAVPMTVLMAVCAIPGLLIFLFAQIQLKQL